MNAVSSSLARQHFAGKRDNVCNDKDPVIITGKGSELVVMMSLDYYEAFEETSYLLRSHVNAERRLKSVNQLESSRGKASFLLE